MLNNLILILRPLITINLTLRARLVIRGPGCKDPSYSLLCSFSVQYAITVMKITREDRNSLSWVADWPHCCDIGGDTCDGLRWLAMLPEASKSQQNDLFYNILWTGLYIKIEGKYPISWHCLAGP